MMNNSLLSTPKPLFEHFASLRTLPRRKYLKSLYHKYIKFAGGGGSRDGVLQMLVEGERRMIMNEVSRLGTE